MTFTHMGDDQPRALGYALRGAMMEYVSVYTHGGIISPWALGYALRGAMMEYVSPLSAITPL